LAKDAIINDLKIKEGELIAKEKIFATLHQKTVSLSNVNQNQLPSFKEMEVKIKDKDDIIE
jgi:hypothetical protein